MVTLRCSSAAYFAFIYACSCIKVQQGFIKLRYSKFIGYSNYMFQYIGLMVLYFILQLVHAQMNELLDSQRDLETRYQSILAKKIDMKHTTISTDKLTEMEREVLETGGDLKNSTHVFTRSVRQSPLTADNMTKIQEDR